MEAEITVEASDVPPRRYVIRPGQRFEIGRSSASVLLIEDDSVSRTHAQIELRSDGEVFVADLNSRNGTFLSERQLQPYRPEPLSPGEAITVGRFRLHVRLGDDQDLTRLHKIDTIELLKSSLPADELEVLGVLGRGGSGVVYAAHQILMDRRVAVKCLDRNVNDESAQRFLVEGRTACRVRSPYVVEVFDFRVHNGRVFMVMELVEGMSLQDHLRDGPLPIHRALRIAAQVAEGLTAVHLEGVIHRDIKPSNILLSPSGQAKLSDFGIAKDLWLDGGLTPTGHGIGTLHYVAPEQAISARQVDERADIYGLGATIYHMIAGRSPQRPTGKRSITEMFDSPPRRLEELRPDCPEPVAKLVARMLDYDPDRRPPSAQVVQAELIELGQRHYAEVSSLASMQRDARVTQTQRTKAVSTSLLAELPGRRGERARREQELD